MNCLQSITRSSIQLVALCLLLQFALAGHVFAICNPAGLELKVNTHIEKGQRDSALAALTKGRFVVTWASFGQDGSDDGIYGQLIDDLGNKVGSEFPVNAYTNSGQYDPSIAGLPEGGFVVTWTSSGQDGSGDGIYGQVFDSAGNKVGSEFPVNTYTTNNQRSSSVAALMAGGFVVAWQSDGQDGNGWGIYSQLFDGAGNKVGSEFLVNSYTTTSQTDPSVAGLSGGGFVVTWRSDGEKDSDWGIDGQMFDSSGNKVGNQFRVNTYITWFEGNGSVVGLMGGGFVATWASYRWDGSQYNVYGQVFDSAGSKVGSEFQVNTYTASDQNSVSVVGLLGEAFLVTWASSGQDGSGYGVYGQVFSSSGNKLGSEFRVNTYTTGSQERPSVAGLSGGRFVVIWQSDGQDGSDFGIYAQRFSCGGGFSKSELAVDFGGTYGLWHYDQERSQPWIQLNTVNPGPMTAVDVNYDGQDELVVAFPGHGLYIYDQANGWTQINTVMPEVVIKFLNGIACDFGAIHGLWLWNRSGGWKQVNTADPDKLIAADTDGDSQDELIVSFVGYGLYIYDEPSGWKQINSDIPNAMIGLNVMR